MPAKELIARIGQFFSAAGSKAASRNRPGRHACRFELLEDRSMYSAMALATAYRPQNPTFQWQAHEVPDATEETLGAGIRRNFDDDNLNGRPDRDDANVKGESDLVHVRLQASDAAQFTLSRSNTNIRVWNSPAKGAAILLNQNQIAIPISGTRDVWVEYIAKLPGTTMLSLDARTSSGQVLASDKIRLYSFQSVVLVFGGRTQVPSDPANSNLGTFQTAIDLYDQGYDVRMYNENQERGLRSNRPYLDTVQAIQKFGENRVGIVGYSCGGGAAYNLAQTLTASRATIGAYTIQFTAYIDGITQLTPRSETRLPPGSTYHQNIYERLDPTLKGNAVAGAAENINVTSAPWGSQLDHYTIDDSTNVRDLVKNRLRARMIQ